MVAGQRGSSRIAHDGWPHASRRPTGNCSSHGRWDNAYEPQRTAQVPDELSVALVANPLAFSVFETLGRSEQYLLMLPLLKAYTAKGKAAALARIIVRLSR